MRKPQKERAIALYEDRGATPKTVVIEVEAGIDLEAEIRNARLNNLQDVDDRILEVRKAEKGKSIIFRK